MARLSGKIGTTGGPGKPFRFPRYGDQLAKIVPPAATLARRVAAGSVSGRMKPYYAYRFETEHSRFSIAKWLGIAAVVFVGGLILELAFFAFLHPPIPEASLTLAEGVPRDVSVTHGRSIEGSVGVDFLEFTVGPYRIQYKSAEPKYKDVLAAVTRVEHGEAIQAWVSTTQSTVFGGTKSSITLYKLTGRGQHVLRYADTAQSAARFRTGVLIAGVAVIALGLRMAYRYFRGGRRREAEPPSPPVATELSSQDLFLFDTYNQRFLDGAASTWRAPPVTPLIWAVSAAGFLIWLAVDLCSAGLRTGWHLSALGTVVLAILGLLAIARHRSGLLREAAIVTAIAECTGRERTVDDNGTDLDVVTVSYTFVTPSGQSVRGALGGPIRPDEFGRWPVKGARFPMAILYFGPADFEVL